MATIYMEKNSILILKNIDENINGFLSLGENSLLSLILKVQIKHENGIGLH